MFPLTAGRVVGEGGRADGASAGRADGASAVWRDVWEDNVNDPHPLPSYIVEDLAAMSVLTDNEAMSGEDDQVLASAPNDVEHMRYKRTEPASSRCDVLMEFHNNNPGTAPPIDPLEVYCLFPPGVDARLDLANPGLHLAEHSKSYMIKNLRGHDVRVKLAKRCFEILASPPPCGRLLELHQPSRNTHRRVWEIHSSCLVSRAHGTRPG